MTIKYCVGDWCKTSIVANTFILLNPIFPMTILYKRGLVYLNTNYQMITGLFELLPLKQIFPVMAGAAMALGVGIGAIVSFLTIQRHLRV